MNDSEFWKIISDCNVGNKFYQNLKALLLEVEPNEIIRFRQILEDKLLDAYLFPLLEVNFIICSYVSDDGFRGFRVWLVSNGLLRFKNALKNPESIANWLDRENVEDIEENDFLCAIDDAYVQITGDDINSKITYWDNPEINFDWPEDKNEFQRKYPKLFNKFWNQQLINELH